MSLIRLKLNDCSMHQHVKRLQCLRVKCLSSGKRRSLKCTQVASWMYDVFSGLESNLSTMKQAVCSMGIPEDIVQLAIDSQQLDHGEGFTEVTYLYTAAEDIFNDFEKQKSIKTRLSLAEEMKKAETQHKDDLCDKSEDSCCTSEAPAIASAEMLKTAEAKLVSANKSQLQMKVRKLARENRRLKERKFCRACKKVELAQSGVTFLPCGHFITCEACSESYDDCPACGKSIMGTVRTFLS